VHPKTKSDGILYLVYLPELQDTLHKSAETQVATSEQNSDVTQPSAPWLLLHMQTDSVRTSVMPDICR
jgi:hypothetical protein